MKKLKFMICIILRKVQRKRRQIDSGFTLGQSLICQGAAGKARERRGLKKSKTLFSFIASLQNIQFPLIAARWECSDDCDYVCHNYSLQPYHYNGLTKNNVKQAYYIGLLWGFDFYFFQHRRCRNAGCNLVQCPSPFTGTFTQMWD